MITVNRASGNDTKIYYYDSKRDIFSPLPVEPGFFEPTHKIIIDSFLNAKDIDPIMSGVMEGIRWEKHFEKREDLWNRLSKKMEILHNEMMFIVDKGGGGCMYKKLIPLQKKNHHLQRVRESISQKSNSAFDASFDT